MEIKELAKDDENYAAVAYDIKLNDKKRRLAIGKPNYTFSKKNIIYFPIYLIENDMFDTRIAVYEIKLNELRGILDKDNDVDIVKLYSLRKPLYFFDVPKLLKKHDNLITTKDELFDDEVDKLLAQAELESDIKPIKLSSTQKPVELVAVGETAVGETAVDKTAVDKTAVDKTAVGKTAVDEISVDRDAIKYIPHPSYSWIQKYLKILIIRL